MTSIPPHPPPGQSPTLAELLASAARASLARQGLHEEAAAFTTERVAAEMGEAGQLRRQAPKRAPESLRARQAQQRARARELDAAGEAVTPEEVPREPRRRSLRVPDAPHERRGRAKFLASVARSSAPDFRPGDWSDRAYELAGAMFNDKSGREAWRRLAELPRNLARKIRRAAFAIAERDGELSRERASLRHVRARRIVALGIVLYREAIDTRRRGMGRVLGGRSRGNVAALFRNPQTGEHYHINTFFSVDCHGTGDPFDCGDVEALEAAGAIYREQPPIGCVPRAWVGPSGYPLNLYWFSERSCSAEPYEHERAELEAFGELDPEAPAPRARAPG